MTKILIPRSDSISAKIIEPSDFEKLFPPTFIRDYRISGFTLSAGSGLAVNISTGTARLKGLYLESSASETVSSLTASDVNYIYVKLARDQAGEAESWDFDKNLTGTTPTDAFFIGTATTDGSSVTSVDMSDVVIDLEFSFLSRQKLVYFGDGSDGSLTTSGASIDRMKQYTNLTLNGAFTTTQSTCATLIIRVSGTLTINNGGSITVSGKGAIGSSTVGQGGLGGGGNSQGTGGGGGEGNGGQGETGIYGVKGMGLGGSGGAGGAGGAGGLSKHSTSKGGRGGLSIISVKCEENIKRYEGVILANTLPQLYGCGGSSGSGGGGGAGDKQETVDGGDGGLFPCYCVSLYNTDVKFWVCSHVYLFHN